MLRLSRIVFNFPYQTIMISCIFAFSSSKCILYVCAHSVPVMRNKFEQEISGFRNLYFPGIKIQQPLSSLKQAERVFRIGNCWCVFAGLEKIDFLQQSFWVLQQPGIFVYMNEAADGQLAGDYNGCIVGYHPHL